jgi:hypothetical protein
MEVVLGFSIDLDTNNHNVEAPVNPLVLSIERSWLNIEWLTCVPAQGIGLLHEGSGQGATHSVARNSRAMSPRRTITALLCRLLVLSLKAPNHFVVAGCWVFRMNRASCLSLRSELLRHAHTEYLVPQKALQSMNEYNNPSFATVFQRALLNTCITRCFGSLHLVFCIR